MSQRLAFSDPYVVLCGSSREDSLGDSLRSSHGDFHGDFRLFQLTGPPNSRSCN